MQVREVEAVERDGPVIGGFESADQVKQRRFPGSGWSSDGDDLAVLRRKSHAPQDLDSVAVWRHKTFSQIDNVETKVIHHAAPQPGAAGPLRELDRSSPTRSTQTRREPLTRSHSLWR